MRPALLRAARVAFSLALAAPLGAAAGVPLPQIEIASGSERCVAPPAEMRRTHMDMLRHQRDRTLRQGERGAQVSLNGCITCHASAKTGAVVGRRDDFCESCHAYAAVELDCFECHQGRTGGRPLAAAGVMR